MQANHEAQCRIVMRTEAFISFYLNQDGASTMLTYVGMNLCDASCKMRGSCQTLRVRAMMFLTAAQNRCIKFMPKMAHALGTGQNSRITVSRNSCLFKVIRSSLVVSAAIIAPPLVMQWRPHGLTAAQNRCIKSMPKMALQKYSFSKLVFIQGDSIRLVVSAAIIAVSTLVFGSSKVASNNHLFTFALRNQETWQTWPWAQKFTIRRCELHNETTCVYHSRLTVSSKSRNERAPCKRLARTCCQPSKFALTSSNGLTVMQEDTLG